MKSREGDFGFSISPDVPALTLPAALHSASWATANGKERKKKHNLKSFNRRKSTLSGRKEKSTL